MSVYVMGSNTYTNHAALRCAPTSTEAVESSIYVLRIPHGSSTLSRTSISVMAKKVQKEFAVACIRTRVRSHLLADGRLRVRESMHGRCTSMRESLILLGWLTGKRDIKEG